MLWPSKACNFFTPSNIYGSYTVHIRFSPYIRRICVYDRINAVYIRPIETHIRSYGYGTGSSVSYTVPDIRRTEDTAYIRSYGLGQPYISA
jgi:hypothetical protein